MSLLALIAKYGDDLYGLTKRLTDAGYPESVAQRIASGELDMEPEVVRQRAIEQGYGDPFDPANRLYHGTDADIREFVPSERGKMGRGVYTATQTKYANKYARGADGDNVMPLVIRGDYLPRSEATAANRELYGPTAMASLSDIVEAQGYQGMAGGLIGPSGKEKAITEYVTFDPSNVKSIYAAFDPQYTGSNIKGFADPTLLGAIATGGAGAAAANTMTDINGNPMPGLGEFILQGLNSLGTGMEVPARGVLGLAEGLGALIGGAPLDQSINRAADTAQMPLTDISNRQGNRVLDVTGSPELAYAANILTLMTDPAVISPI